MCHATIGGSSPQAWGTQAAVCHRCARHRLIPTGVGNTLIRRGFLGRGAAHPHRRGEHRLLQSKTSSSDGSSPQAWGTPNRNSSHRAQQRLIPTGVGNTRRGLVYRSGLSAHPHRRGEHQSRKAQLALIRGSSPQAWGTRTWEYRSSPPRRLIPTGVGNTSQDREHDPG